MVRNFMFIYLRKFNFISNFSFDQPHQNLNIHLLEMFAIQHTSIGPDFILIGLKIQKKQQKCNFHYVAMLLVMSQILKSVDFTKTQKSTYLENETLILLQIKKIINCASRDTLWQKLVLQRRQPLRIVKRVCLI